jgi:UDP-N-acetylglucosamine acyltransferase
MPRKISGMSHIDPRAELADDVEIGPFCFVGPQVKIGEGCKLDSHVTIIGKTTIGSNNRFFPNSVIGGDPQDIGYSGSDTETIIGDNNLFREGVTINRGADKEDRRTVIGNHCMLMSNSHVAHNCVVGNHVILVNGVLLGGHVHVHDRVIISGNSVVHHFSTLGTLSFVSGGCRVPHDIPPYMLSAGSDNPEIKSINVVGMKRSGISDSTIHIIRQAYKLLYRDFKTLDVVKEDLANMYRETIPFELTTLYTFLENQAKGKQGRAREAFRNAPPAADNNTDRKAA